MKYRLLLLLFFFSTAVFAQIQNQKGSITLKNGETLSGSVTYYYDSPNELNFYDEAGKKQVLEPDQIKEIKLENGERFVAKSYVLNKDSTNLILQTLIESPEISLYSREDGANRFFYVSKHDVLYRLENNDLKVVQGRKTYTRKDYKYIGTLNFLMSDRIELLDRLQKIKLNEDDLTKVILDYNKGNISYYWSNDNEKIKEFNWVLFAQYSQYGSYFGEFTNVKSSGQLAGLQYYFSTHSRHSVKFALDYSYYSFSRENFEVAGLGFRYEYAFKQSEKYNAYLMLHLFDVAYVAWVNERQGMKTQESLALIPRFSPGIGFEARPWSKIALYAELNHIIVLKQLPKSFSVGLKYDFGKTSW